MLYVRARGIRAAPPISCGNARRAPAGKYAAHAPAFRRAATVELRLRRARVALEDLGQAVDDGRGAGVNQSRGVAIRVDAENQVEAAGVRGLEAGARRLEDDGLLRVDAGKAACLQTDVWRRPRSQTLLLLTAGRAGSASSSAR